MSPVGGPSGARAPSFRGATEELFELQLAQLRHDEAYHPEIVRFTTHARLNHMALHFSKYVGQMAEAVAQQDFEKIKRTIVDTFIIDLCTANTLRIRLSTKIRDLAADRMSLTDFALMSVEQESNLSPGGNWLIAKYAVEAGRVAKACEKIDHLEAYPFREKIEEAVGDIGRYSLAAAQIHGFDLASAVQSRLQAVEEKYLFHNSL